MTDAQKVDTSPANIARLLRNAGRFAAEASIQDEYRSIATALESAAPAVSLEPGEAVSDFPVGHALVNLLDNAVMYVAKGLNDGVYASTVGGDKCAERLLARLQAASKGMRQDHGCALCAVASAAPAVREAEPTCPECGAANGAHRVANTVQDECSKLAALEAEPTWAERIERVTSLLTGNNCCAVCRDCAGHALRAAFPERAPEGL